MKIGSRIIDSSGNIGTVLSFRQHPHNVQEAEIKFDDHQAGSLYNHRAVRTLSLMNGKESLPDVLSDIYKRTSASYESACQSGNDRAQYVLSAQIAVLKMIAARTLNITL